MLVTASALQPRPNVCVNNVAKCGADSTTRAQHVKANVTALKTLSLDYIPALFLLQTELANFTRELSNPVARFDCFIYVLGTHGYRLCSSVNRFPLVHERSVI